MRRIIIGALTSLALVCGVGGGVAVSTAAASGADYIWYQGYLANGGAFGPRHTLYDVDADASGSSDPVCVNALDSPANTWAGSTVCGSGYADHAYCNCALRFGWGGGGAGSTPVFMDAYQYWGY